MAWPCRRGYCGSGRNRHLLPETGDAGHRHASELAILRDRHDVYDLVGTYVSPLILVLRPLTKFYSVLIFVLFVYACRETHLRRRYRRDLAAMMLQQKTEIEPAPTNALSVPAPMIIACNCQEEIYDHLVAGAPNDQPPEYPAVAREAYAAGQGKLGASV